MVPSNPAAVHASLTALRLPWGLSWRNSFKKLVLPGVTALLGILGADFSLAAVLEYPLRLPVSFTLVLLTRVGLIVPSNPAACQASFTSLVLPWGLALRKSFTKLVLPGVTVAVPGMLEAAFSLAAILEFPRRLPVSPSCFRTTLMTGRLIVPFIPAAVHASFTALALAWGLPWRNSLTKLVLPGAAVAVVAMRASPGRFKRRPVSTGGKHRLHVQRNLHELQDSVAASLGWLPDRRCILSIALSVSSDGMSRDGGIGRRTA